MQAVPHQVRLVLPPTCTKKEVRLVGVESNVKHTTLQAGLSGQETFSPGR
jgi:hypothetical protein